MGNHKNKKNEDDQHESTLQPTGNKKNKQKQNEVSTSQEKDFDVSPEDLNENELQGTAENQPYRNAELENEAFNQSLGTGQPDKKK